MGRTTARDLIMRESALMDYTIPWITQLEQLVSAIQLNCNPLSPMYFEMGILLASLAHKMATLSQSLSYAATISGDPSLNVQTTYQSALLTCYQHLEAKGIRLTLADLDNLAGQAAPMDPMRKVDIPNVM